MGEVAERENAMVGMLVQCCTFGTRQTKTGVTPSGDILGTHSWAQPVCRSRLEPPLLRATPEPTFFWVGAGSRSRNLSGAGRVKSDRLRQPC